MATNKIKKEYLTENFKERLVNLTLINNRIKQINEDLIKINNDIFILEENKKLLLQDLYDWKREKAKISCLNIEEIYLKNKSLNK